MSSLSPFTCKTATLPAVSLLEQHIPFDEGNVEVYAIYFEKYEDAAPLAQEKATSAPCQRKRRSVITMNEFEIQPTLSCLRCPYPL